MNLKLNYIISTLLRMKYVTIRVLLTFLRFSACAEILQINKFKKKTLFDTEPFDRSQIHVGFVVHKEAHR
jgi:hypothetical protein